MNGKRVLIVDDEDGVLFLCSEGLEREGLTVDKASNGLKGLEMLENASYDLVITEINLPHLTGADLYLRAVKKRPDLEERFIFISGAEPVDMRVKDIVKGKIMIKPFFASELVGYVAATLERLQRDAPGSRE